MLDRFIEIYTDSEHLIKWVLWIAFISSIFLDVSRIKIDPWKCLLRKLASIFNGEVLEAVNVISKRMDCIEHTHLEQQKQNIRRSILQFADECRISRKHSQEMFLNALRDIDEYERLCRLTTDPNNVVKEAIEYIRETYHNRLINNDFL
jgi:hypothetical protein